jgi:hypothetical protein
MIVVKT